MNRESGSILILTIMSVLVLSVLVVGLLTVGNTEIQTTHNYYMNKMAYYTAMQGIEQVRDQILQQPEPQHVTAIIYTADSTKNTSKGLSKSFMTGTIRDMQSGITRPITQFQGFSPPPFPGLSLGGITSIAPVVWDVTVSADIRAGSKRSLAEIQSGVYSVLTVGY